MDKVVNRTQLAEKRYWDTEIKKDYKIYKKRTQETKKTTKITKEKAIRIK